MPFDEVLRARVEGELKARIIRLMRQPEHRGRDEATLLRMACEDYCAAEEKRLRMKPITPAEVEDIMGALLAERTQGRPTPAPRPIGPVTYRKKPAPRSAGSRSATDIPRKPRPLGQG